MDPLVERFMLAGLPKGKAEQTAKNDKLAPILADIISSAHIVDANQNVKQGSLLLQLASGGLEIGKDDRVLLAQGIVDGRITSLDQLTAGIAYLHDGGDRSTEKVNRACGVGVVVSPETISNNVRHYMQENKSSLAETTWSNLASALQSLKLAEDLRWANPLDIKKNLESAFTEKYGSKEAYNKASSVAAKASKQQSKPPASATGPKMDVVSAKSGISGGSTSAAAISATDMFEEGFLAKLHAVGGNSQLREQLRNEHMRATGGVVHTRFPPEPNGYLHIGHSKAIAINFGYAQYHNGRCYLRYDDTNPEAEEEIYIDSCLDIIRWLGFEPWKITYSSDHFQKLYELAIELVKRDKAYMCYCSAEEMNTARGGPERGPRKACSHRNRPLSESLKAFEEMQQGAFQPGEAVLRMKQDLEDGNPQMWDLVAYRTLKKPHHRTGTEWCIYPTYDFTHCLCDSFENITHSLCTTEFVQSRVSYEWLCDALEVYKPRQSEYGRLKLQGTFLSKRKILNLVTKGVVSGWDDPRLYTLIALRRRGIPPGAILSFVNGLGVTTATSTLGTHRFEQSVRSYLETSTPRLMLVLVPLKVTLENVPEDYVEHISKPLHTKDPSMGRNVIPLTRTIYIDASDFRTEGSTDFFRLTPGKTVGLLYATYPITCMSYKTEEKTGNVIEVFARYEGFSANAKPGKSDKVPTLKVKTYIHWVGEHKASNSPLHVRETRIFKQLFKSDDPAAEDDYLSDVNPESLQVIKGAMLEVGINDLVEKVRKGSQVTSKEEQQITSDPRATLSGGTNGGNERVRFQGLRTAYFCLDKDAKIQALEKSMATEERTQTDEIVLNWIVSLKEDKAR